MTLAEKLSKESNQVYDVAKEIKNEIVSNFTEIFDDGRFEDWLERRISTNSEKLSREYQIGIEFWNYHDGCSETNFRIGGFLWYNPENKDGYKGHRYKNIELYDIHRDVCFELYMLAVDRLEKMGFVITKTTDKECWLKQYHKEITISW